MCILIASPTAPGDWTMLTATLPNSLFFLRHIICLVKFKMFLHSLNKPLKSPLLQFLFYLPTKACQLSACDSLMLDPSSLFPHLLV